MSVSFSFCLALVHWCSGFLYLSWTWNLKTKSQNSYQQWHQVHQNICIIATQKHIFFIGFTFIKLSSVMSLWHALATNLPQILQSQNEIKYIYTKQNLTAHKYFLSSVLHLFALSASCFLLLLSKKNWTSKNVQTLKIELEFGH